MYLRGTGGHNTYKDTLYELSIAIFEFSDPQNPNKRHNIRQNKDCANLKFFAQGALCPQKGWMGH